MARISKSRLRHEIKSGNGNASDLAETFGVSPQTVYNWLDKYDLRDEFEAQQDLATKTRLLEVIEQSSGLVTELASAFRVSRQTIYNWLDKYDLRDALEDQRDNVWDVAMGNVFTAVLNGDVPVSQWLLMHMPGGLNRQRWSNKVDLSAEVRQVEELTWGDNPVTPGSLSDGE